MGVDWFWVVRPAGWVARLSGGLQPYRPVPNSNTNRDSTRRKFATDSPQEGGVSCELVSENAKFPASREFTGNFIDSGLGGASEAAKKGMKSVSYGPIPYAS